MFHSLMTGSNVVNTYYKNILENYVEFMPGGRYFYPLYLKKATCLGIALLVNGDVVAIQKYCCLNKIILNDDEYRTCLRLSYNYVGCTFWLLDTCQEDSIKKYNDSLLNCYLDSAICVYYIFNKGEEK